jgi:hypothetical protein
MNKFGSRPLFLSAEINLQGNNVFRKSKAQQKCVVQPASLTGVVNLQKCWAIKLSSVFTGNKICSNLKQKNEISSKQYEIERPKHWCIVYSIHNSQTGRTVALVGGHGSNCQDFWMGQYSAWILHLQRWQMSRVYSQQGDQASGQLKTVCLLNFSRV